uniref:Uncharacterized protein n=1 Tax=Arion vulgaris TaxID=1028688 RepID=A0A0B6Z8P6_9EUPU
MTIASKIRPQKVVKSLQCSILKLLLKDNVCVIPNHSIIIKSEVIVHDCGLHHDMMNEDCELCQRMSPA